MIQPIHVLSFRENIATRQAKKIIQRAIDNPEYDVYHDEESMTPDEPIVMSNVIWRKDFHGMRWNVGKQTPKSGYEVLGSLIPSIASSFNNPTPDTLPDLVRAIRYDTRQLGIPEPVIHSLESQFIIDMPEVLKWAHLDTVEHMEELFNEGEIEVNYHDYIPIPRDITEGVDIAWGKPPRKDHLLQTYTFGSRACPDYPDNRNGRMTEPILTISASVVILDKRIHVSDLYRKYTITQEYSDFIELDNLLKMFATKFFLPEIVEHLYSQNH